MIKVAITGNIGSGKSTIAQIFAGCGDPIFSADDIITELYHNNKHFYKDICDINPTLTENGAVSKKKIIDYLQLNPDFLSTLEALLYPLLQKERNAFILDKTRHEYDFVICEVPLLFEKNMQDDYDQIILIYADKDIRWDRVKNRPHMTKEKFDFICTQQTDYKNIQKACDLTLDTNQDLEKTTLDILNFRNNLVA